MRISVYLTFKRIGLWSNRLALYSIAAIFTIHKKIDIHSDFYLIFEIVKQTQKIVLFCNNNKKKI